MLLIYLMHKEWLCLHCQLFTVDVRFRCGLAAYVQFETMGKTRPGSIGGGHRH